MTEPTSSKQMTLEMLNIKNMGNKRFHSDTSLQNFGEEESKRNPKKSEKDPGVSNSSMSNLSLGEGVQPRVRHMSQPGPLPTVFSTATAARAARRRPCRAVNYAADLERTDSSNGSTTPKLFLSLGVDSETATPTLAERISPVGYNNNLRNGDSKSLSNYRINSTYDRGGFMLRKRSAINNDVLSLRSVETQAPPPTSPEDNKRLTIKYLASVFSSIYAIFLVTLGIILFIADVFTEVRFATIYSLLLTVIGFVYHIYLIIDIRKYKKLAHKNEKIKTAYEDNIAQFYQEDNDSIDGSSEARSPRSSPPKPPPPLLPLKHAYCFKQGRHSGSFYLKMGAAGFAVGHLIHSTLLIAVQLAFVFDETFNNDQCLDHIRIVLDFLVPANSFIQLYFIFKYSNVIILKNQGLAHFGFMHMVGSSLCFWVSTIIRETVLALTLHTDSDHDISATDSESSEHTHYDDRNNAGDFSSQINFIQPQINCVMAPAIDSIFTNYSPYLYPFSVEFHILIVGVYYIIWNNVGKCNNEDSQFDGSSYDGTYNICKIPTNQCNEYISNVVIFADCHRSNRGMFAGILIIVIIAGSLILSYVFNTVDEKFYNRLGNMVSDITKLTLNILMFIAAVTAYNQLRKLDINEHPISLLDDILLFICLPAFFMEVTLSMVAVTNILNVVKCIDFIVMMVQVLIQTALLVDGLRRCSNSRKLRRSKPGRELLMFLIIANVGTWILNTLSYKSPKIVDERVVYYGEVLWTLLGHFSLPLTMFYRFHSSVCFADIWDSAYRPGDDQ